MPEINDVTVMELEDKPLPELVQLIDDILCGKVHNPVVCPNSEEYMKAFRTLAYTKFASGLSLEQVWKDCGMIYEYYDKMDSSGLFFSAQFLTHKDAEFVLKHVIAVGRRCHALQTDLMTWIQAEGKLPEVELILGEDGVDTEKLFASVVPDGFNPDTSNGEHTT